MSRGIIIFAQNNEYVNYAETACASAGYARKNLSLFDEICLITNTETLESNETLINEYFDRVIVSSIFQPENIRLFKDTTDKLEYASFKNMSRSEVYELSPYDETVVIDGD
jgi:predicted glycosyltransferase